MKSSIIQIGIADDHAILRRALRGYFRDQTDMRVAGEAATGREAVNLVRTTRMDVLVMDISMPEQNGLDALATIRSRAPDLAVLVFTMHSEEQYALPVLKQGAAGFLSKECDPPEILDAVRTLAQGRRYLSPKVGQLLAQAMGSNLDAPHERLTERELQVFLKLAAGASSHEVADSLYLSPKTVSTYRSRILDKLGMHTNADLTYYAVKHNLVV